MSFDAVIIGGGLSGLSAGVDLAHSGLKVAIVEQKPFFGGRTYSFADSVTGDEVDNGQHLMMGCYHETRHYLRRIGSDGLAFLQPALRIPFLHPTLGKSVLSCPPLPAPLHVQAGLFGLASLPLAQRMNLLRVGVQLLGKMVERNASALDSMTVREWLTRLGQGDQAQKYLWDVIAIGSLNDDPSRVSALLFARVLRAAFLGRREHSSLLIPQVGLSKLLVDPALDYLKKKGGRLIAGTRIGRLEIDGDSALSVWCEDGLQIRAPWFISAVPLYALKKILDAQGLASTNVSPLATVLSSSPIISMTLWLDREVIEEPFMAVLDCDIQWIFNRSKILRDGLNKESGRQCLSIVVSAASSYVAMDQKALIAMAIADLHRLIPRSRDARVVHALVIKERRATFTPAPGLEHLRPGTSTSVRNLFLAGDWTGTGYPSTIEGAVMSGRRAAAAVLQHTSG